MLDLKSLRQNNGSFGKEKNFFIDDEVPSQVDTKRMGKDHRRLLNSDLNSLGRAKKLRKLNV